MFCYQNSIFDFETARRPSNRSLSFRQFRSTRSSTINMITVQVHTEHCFRALSPNGVSRVPEFDARVWCRSLAERQKAMHIVRLNGPNESNTSIKRSVPENRLNRVGMLVLFNCSLQCSWPFVRPPERRSELFTGLVYWQSHAASCSV